MDDEKTCRDTFYVWMKAGEESSYIHQSKLQFTPISIGSRQPLLALSAVRWRG